MMNLYEILKRRYILFKTNSIKKKLGACGKECSIFSKLSKPQNIFLGDYTLIQPNCTFIIHTGKFIIKKWSSLSCNCTIVTGNHTPTVGINQRLLGRLHFNDKEKDIIVEEDCWIGANVTLLSGAHIGRGTVVGACSLVNKKIPPYAVVVGTPARIIASKFSYEEVLEHEKKLYPKEERLSPEYLKEIFDTFYRGKRSIGINYISEELRNKLASIDNLQYEI